MNICFISSRYPSLNNPYNHMFIHMRCLEMLKQGHSVKVYVPSAVKKSYLYEGVEVLRLPSKDIVDFLKDHDVIYLHLLNIYPFSKIDGWRIYKYIMKNNIPFAMYVHGNEVQRYSARMFEFDFSIKEFLKWIKKDLFVIPKIKKFAKSTINWGNSEFIFPSVWMKDDMEANLNVKFNNFHIIPNGIDTNMFKFHEQYEKRFKLLTLRPLSSKKYAVDVAIDIMSHLPDNFTLEIYGKGKYEKKYQEKIKNLKLEDKVTINDSFIERRNLNGFFSNYGILLSPTRMDAQGVSMCEAMSSGVLVVSSNNTAIPEFVRHMENGIIGDDAKEIANIILQVVKDKESYSKLVLEGRRSMEEIDISNTVRKELELLKKCDTYNE